MHVELSYPDEAARRQLVQRALTNVPLNYDENPALPSPEAVAAYVAERTSGKSAGEIAAVFREAAMATLRDRLDAESVAMHHVTQAVADGSSQVVFGMRGKDQVQRPRGMRFRREHGSDRRPSVRNARSQAKTYAASRRVPA